MTLLLEVRGISKSFKGLKAVNEASFAVDDGAIVAMIGPNGAGKTTCFNLIAGALQPDEGQVILGGRDVTGLRADLVCRAGVGRTFQIVKPFAGLSVLDNVVVGAFKDHDDLREARAKAGEIIDLLGLWPKRDQPAAALTLPERKCLEVARALATEPKLLLLDEVMAGLRPTETDQMVAIFRRLNQRRGLTILLIEHVMRAVMALAQRVVVLHHGEIIANDEPSVVVRDPRVIQSYLGQEGHG